MDWALLWAQLWGAPQPRFYEGEILHVHKPPFLEKGAPRPMYLVTNHRQYTRIPSESQKQWIYSGGLYVIRNEQLVYYTRGDKIKEKGLAGIPRGAS